MAGRQAHGKPLSFQRSGGRHNGNQANGGVTGKQPTGRRRPGAPRQRPGRRIDVLAMAERQLGEQKTKGLRKRDLDVDDEEEEEEREGGGGKRRRREEDDEDDDDDEGGDENDDDDDDEHWHVGVNSDDDDSEIDSDLASGGEESDLDDDGSSLGEDAIDLATALDQVSDDEEEEPKKSKKSKKSKESKKASDSESESDSASDTDMDSDSDSDSDSDDAVSDLDFSSEDDDGEALRLDHILPKSALKRRDEAEDDDSDDDRVTLDALNVSGVQFQGMDDSDDSDDDSHGLKLTAVDREVRAELAKASSKVIDVPLERMRQDQLLRKAAAEKAHETLGRWTETVKQNRRADHLSFPVAGSLQAQGLQANAPLQPLLNKSADAGQNELERTVLAIMEESGLGAQEEAERRRRKKELEQNPDAQEGLTDAERQAMKDRAQQIVADRRRERIRQAQKQAEAKRVKKIKSKSYRRVHRRERNRLDEDEGSSNDEEEDTEEAREARHRQRALERVGAKHRANKWAKGGKQTGRAAWDDEFRTSMMEMAQKEAALRERIEGRGYDDDEEEEEEVEEGQEEEEEDAKEHALEQMPFMRRATEARKKEQARLEKDMLREELGSEFEDDDDDDEDKDNDRDEVGRRSFGMGNAAPPKKAKKKRDIMDGRGVEEDDEEEDEEEEEEVVVPKTTSTTTTTSRAKKNPLSSSNLQTASAATATSDPWAVAAKSKSKKSQEAVAKKTKLATDAIVEKADKVEKVDKVKSKTVDKSKSKEDKSKKPVAFSDMFDSENDSENDNQIDMADLADDDDEAAFAAEKQRIATEEAGDAVPEDNSASALQGWGAWGGSGLGRRQKQRTRARVEAAKAARAAAVAEAVAARRDAKLKGVVVSERKAKKNFKYMATGLPHEFETRHQYERSLRLPVGPEWTTKQSFQEATKPRLLTKQGIVLPMAKPAL